MGTPKVVCLQSQTIAAELTLRVLGIGPGDEVIVPAYTYTASASIVDHVGAKLILIDSQPNSLEMDYDALASAITERTKAIIPVDLGGVICDYERIFEIVESKRKLFKPKSSLQQVFGRVIVISDAAHALGSKRLGIPAGQWADFSNFSFHAVKNLTTAEGGCTTWKAHPDLDDEELYRQYMLFSLHGQSKDALAKTQKGAWEYDIVMPGYKGNMTDIMAAIGLVQLERYPQMLIKRQHIAELYNRAFAELPLQIRPLSGADFESCHHLYMIRLSQQCEAVRNQFIVKMAEKGVACNVHYKPLPMFTAYKQLGFKISDFPNAFSLYQNEVTLPLHTCLTEEMVDHVIQSVVETCRELEL